MKGATRSCTKFKKCKKHFNPRSHEGSDWFLAAHDRNDFFISIHAPMKGATRGRRCAKQAWKFQSTLPWRERPSQRFYFERGAKFQSTLPWRERHKIESASNLFSDFNPRSHEGSDGNQMPAPGDDGFIFQSTLPWRERRSVWPEMVGGLVISIHAPMKGATRRYCVFLIVLHNFNPRSHEGSDYGNRTVWMEHIKFQSTLPWRERPSASTSIAIILEFQSTLPWRERPVHDRIASIHDDISIHAPMKGATENAYFNMVNQQNFNPRSHEGSDDDKPNDVVFVDVFQSTLPWRERL